ncbi:ricin B lectin domain-containing protein [Phanerochaete sordida]|uniref:Ricin B lectin domain-containing protein n=1 Tax=Phanerochaete sordida TaxID=48140 RepID=A0A9P3G738_9APHY|nr:ricin B lectin domain-containing protein [Phanerochaete sordida]
MAAKIVQSGVYFIQNVASGTVLDLVGGSDTDGTKVTATTKRELCEQQVATQLWVIQLDDNERDSQPCHIESAASRTYLDLTNGTSDLICNGLKGRNDDPDNQWWLITRDSKRTAYVIFNTSTKTYVTLKDGKVASGTSVVGASGTGSATTDTNQLWHIVRA